LFKRKTSPSGAEAISIGSGTNTVQRRSLLKSIVGGSRSSFRKQVENSEAYEKQQLEEETLEIEKHKDF